LYVSLKSRSELEMRFPLFLVYVITVIKTNQAERAMNPNSESGTFLEIVEVEIFQFIETVAGIEEQQSDNLVTGDGDGKFCGMDNSS